MKKLTITLNVLLLSLFISCSSGSDDDDIINPPPTNNDVTYAAHVKSIIDSRCLSCHGNPTANSAPMSLTTYSEVKSAVETRNLIGRVEDGTMPPTGADLTSAQVQTIKDWQSGGFKQ
jgi:mono/diheme cytochrome c family protein